MSNENKKNYCPIIDDYDKVDLEISKYCLQMQMQAIRKLARFTQKDLATITGISSSTISRFESGGDITLKNAFKIAKACGYEITIRKLTEGEK